MKICPYCESELSNTARKCKHCGERVDKKEINKGTNIIGEHDKIATKGSRFMSRFMDFILAFTVIGGFINLYYIFFKHTTLGNIRSGIGYQTIRGENLKNYKIYLRIYTICPHITFALLGITIGLTYLFRHLFVNNGILFYPYLGGIVPFLYCIFFILNIIELFFKEPTFIEKLIGLKRVQINKPKKGIFYVFLFVFLIFCYCYGKYDLKLINNSTINSITSHRNLESSNSIKKYSCEDVIKIKYKAVDDFAYCNGQIGKEWLIGGNTDNLNEKRETECVNNLLDNYNSKYGNSYEQLNCNGSGEAVLNILDTFYSNFSECFNKIISDKKAIKTHNNRLKETNNKCTNDALYDYVKIVNYIDYIKEIGFYNTGNISNQTDSINTQETFNDVMGEKPLAEESTKITNNKTNNKNKNSNSEKNTNKNVVIPPKCYNLEIKVICSIERYEKNYKDCPESCRDLPGVADEKTLLEVTGWKSLDDHTTVIN